MTASELPFGLTADALAAAQGEPDPGGFAALSRLRAQYGPEVAAAAVTQVILRRRAEEKFGPRAAAMLFTRAGLEQATRPAVAAHHAARFRAAGVGEVVDLGCGIGSDALAFAEAGLRVRAVDVAADAAAVASANLAAWPGASVREADAVEECARLGDAPHRGWFVDPARRTGAGRVWRVTQFRPPWSLVTSLLQEPRVTGVKLGPGLPHALVPPGVEAEWVSHHGDAVEVGLWSGGTALPGIRRATVLREGAAPEGLLIAAPQPDLEVAAPRRFLLEPDKAVIRAGGVRQLGAALAAAQLHPGIAYLTADHPAITPLATTFEVFEVLPFRVPALREWLRRHEVAAVEIKKRGVEVDPAQLRRQVLPQPVRGGDAGWTLIITPTLSKTVALAARRVTKE